MWQVLLAGDVPDHSHVDRLSDDRAQRHRDRRRLRVGAGRAAGGQRQVEAGRQDSATRVHLHAAPRPSSLARPFRHQSLRRCAQVGGNGESGEPSSAYYSLRT